MKKKKDDQNSLAGWNDVFTKQGENLSNAMNKILADQEERALNIKKAYNLFHKLWGEAHDSPDYNKQNWIEMQKILKNLGIPA